MAGAAVVTVLINSMGASPWEGGPPLVEQLAWGTALTLPLVARRRFPLTVLFVVGALLIAAQARQVGDNLVPSVALFLAIFSAGAWGRDRTRARWARIAVIVGMFGWLGFGLVRFLLAPAPPFEDAAGPLDPVLAAVVVRHLVQRAVLRVRVLLRRDGVGRRPAAGRAGAPGRAAAPVAGQTRAGASSPNGVRIARELHDVVAHHVSVMGVQARRGRRVLDRDPDLARTALRTRRADAPAPRSTSCAACSACCGPDADDAGAGGRDAHRPGWTSCSSRRPATAGLTARTACTASRCRCPTRCRASAYRIVQEALTNV